MHFSPFSFCVERVAPIISREIVPTRLLPRSVCVTARRIVEKLRKYERNPENVRSLNMIFFARFPDLATGT